MSSPARPPEAGLLAPVSGELIALDDVPDPVFSSGALGLGYGVTPGDGRVVAPVAGTITLVAATALSGLTLAASAGGAVAAGAPAASTRSSSGRPSRTSTTPSSSSCPTSGRAPRPRRRRRLPGRPRPSAG
ncbi:PTS glucose transporter subunit IIA [Actinomyces howellii]|uniref:PTS glucose transporter subunit IIA n=1 Tax=Actinomyces howellii TaxID=52771 RepID=UPI001E47424C|nr:PTS glucose transporter subunit IIA [Actinomyces howellii]